MDRWTRSSHLPNFIDALRLGRQSGYHFAISNPCFEFWLTLHFAEIDPDEPMNCDAVCRRLGKLAAGYSKQFGCKTAITSGMVHDAIRRSKLLDVTADEIPQTPLTRVYLIVEELLLRDSISLG